MTQTVSEWHPGCSTITRLFIWLNYSGSVSGSYIFANGDYSFVGGGNTNSAIGSGSGVVSGCQNSAAGIYSFVGGGGTNLVDGASNYSTISGGYQSTICNAGYSHAFIGGGCVNRVAANCSSVVGGANNLVAGAYSAILGGSGNTVSAAYEYAGIFGCNITTQISNALHLENLWLNPTAYCHNPGVAIGVFPPGTVYVDTLANNTLRVQ